MDTRHLTNFSLPSFTRSYRILAVILGFVCLIIALYSDNPKLLIVGAFCIIALLGTGYYLMLRSRVMFTLTPTHFQQHFYKGGWVLKWNNIQKIGLCTYEQDGWHQPLPWIGIKVKDYSPYLDSICPKITCELLLSQRALLYLGAKQAGKESNFEDMVLDSSHYHTRCTENGCVELSYKESKSNDEVHFNAQHADSHDEANNQNAIIKDYSGLQAMLANRMKYQRGFHGYDIFISTHDLNISGEEFVGLARRYLAAAERLSD
ncbi:DUF2982 domain-containing protein [Vibrio crassostreae]|nr:DUF2982 domain-containing protein [Vibrio crassostreae]CAK3273361.1 DUF2982 domain-containing protein [Vibrio crassostreae]CAK3296662.1 DUF2982 domain-containing protein [Vibrio crassostreae]CAK3309259.1 DUF2982 domain-containing protein [Vibrio crassostreae]CAK3326820.1 DUF2982 domain-containing protein [Vibrio crassostreae]